jgi:hypothetical protein
MRRRICAKAQVAGKPPQPGPCRTAARNAFDLPPSFWHTPPLSERCKGGTDMALHSQLNELERKHQSLEREIQDAMAHPSTDGLKLAELKRKKLQLKDEITKIRSSDRVIH